jgi:hypothetical protein
MYPTDNVLYSGQKIPFKFKPLAAGLYQGVPVWINSYGFRDREFKKNSDKVLRIIMIGDSIVFGHGLSLEDTIGKRLESKLNRRLAGSGRSFEIFNLGIPGTTSFEHYLLTQRALDFEPDLVIWVYYLNDPKFYSWNRESGKCGVEIPFTYIITEYLKNRSRLVSLVLDRTNTLISTYQFGNPNEFFLIHEDSYPGFQCVKKSLNEAGRLLYNKGVRSIFAVYPVTYAAGKEYVFKSLHEKVIQVAGKTGFNAVDLSPAFKSVSPLQVQLNELDRHPNGLANDMTAKADK